MTTKTGVAIVGASGYAARELIRIMLGHPHAELTVATSRRTKSRALEALHPSLARRTTLRCEPFDAERLAGERGFRLSGAAAYREHGHRARAAPARRARHRPERRLSPDRSAGLRGLVRPRAHRCRRAARGGLRPARAFSRADSAGRPDRQPGLLHLGEHPGAGAPGRRGPDRANRDHHRRQERSLRRRPLAQADVPLPRMQREPLGLQRGPAPAHARDRPGADRRHAAAAARRSR